MQLKREESHWLASAVFCLMLAAPGCHRYLVATPNVLQKEDPRQVYAACPPDCQSPEASVLYATDRAPTGVKDQSPTYGYGRAKSLAFGVANVSLTPRTTWTELIEDSTRPNRSHDYQLALAAVREVGRIKPQPQQVASSEAGGAITRTAAKITVAPEAQFQELLHRRLAQSSRKDVYIFIHGFNNTFEDGVFRIAELWHFMGRVGVPISYSWPAGLGGLRGYAYDRESGEYTVSHLREFLKSVAGNPEVERIHLVAHSRGTDVTVSALRELNLEYKAKGLSTQQELKLENFVLAAPDIDEDVFVQRCVGENLLQAARRTTIYASANDHAIEAADIIFASRQRLGSLGIKDVSPKIRNALSKLPYVQFIECKLSTNWAINHDYVFSHPAALSDLILVLRDGRPPGAENGRPLHNPEPGTWELTDDYLK